MSRLAATALALLAGSLMAEAAVGNLRVKMPGAPLTRQGKCVTCRTLVDAVGKTMENEKPHQNVDSRKPIRKENGERTGKVTDYKVSELRAMNIMETLCGGVTRPTDVKWVMGPIGPRSPKSSILKLVDKLGACPFQFLLACLPQKPAAATVVVPYTAFHIAAPGRHILNAFNIGF